MRRATAGLVVVLLLAGSGVAAYGLLADGGGGLTATWVSGTDRETSVNHHTPAAGFAAGRPFVFAPISSSGGETGGCSLTALAGANGSVVWHDWIRGEDCISHAVADPTLADYDGDGVREVLAATTEEALVAYAPTTGDVELRVDLTDYGYTKPVVADLLPGDGSEVVVVDVSGALFVVEPDGSVAWRHDFGTYTWGQPRVADFDADDAPEIAVATGAGNVTLFEANGSVAWTRDTSLSATWSASAQADDDPAVEFAVTGPSGRVLVVDGATGDVEFETDVGRFGAVHAFGDGDGDDVTELYVVNRDGVLHAIEVATGETDWETTLTTADVQMMPPPSLGDVDGDDAPELVAPTNDGSVLVLDPETGAVTAQYSRDVPIWTNVRLADLDRDGVQEVYLVYGDGRVVRLNAT